MTASSIYTIYIRVPVTNSLIMRKPCTLFYLMRFASLRVSFWITYAKMQPRRIMTHTI